MGKAAGEVTEADPALRRVLLWKTAPPGGGVSWDSGGVWWGVGCGCRDRRRGSNSQISSPLPIGHRSMPRRRG